MSMEDVLQGQAEQSEYARVVSKRIGELVADKVSTEGFLNASDDDLRNMAMTILLLVMNELGDEALTSASDTLQALGFKKPTAAAHDRARQTALEGNANRLYTALEEERAKAQKAASRNRGTMSDSLGLGITAALALAFSNAAQGLATDLPVELNGAMAEQTVVAAAGGAAAGAAATEKADTGAAKGAAGAGAAVAAGDAESGWDGLAGLAGLLAGGAGTAESTLTWITRYDDSVCQEDGPAVTTPSGAVMPEGAGTSCEGRHGITLPASDWISEGFPRDARLLCSRFGKRGPQCRCLLSVSANVPDTPVNIAPAVARGRAAGEAEQLDLTDAHLNGLSVTATGEKASSDLWNLSIRVSKRTPVLA